MPDEYTTAGGSGPPRRLSDHSRGELQDIAIERGHPEWVGFSKEDLIKRLES